MIAPTAVPILASPLILLVWLIDSYLFLASLRLVLGNIAATTHSPFCRGLRSFIDPIPQAVAQYIANHRGRPLPPYLPWLIVLGTGIVVRHVVLGIILSF